MFTGSGAEKLPLPRAALQPARAHEVGIPVAGEVGNDQLVAVAVVTLGRTKGSVRSTKPDHRRTLAAADDVEDAVAADIHGLHPRPPAGRLQELAQRERTGAISGEHLDAGNVDAMGHGQIERPVPIEIGDVHSDRMERPRDSYAAAAENPVSLASSTSSW